MPGGFLRKKRGALSTLAIIVLAASLGMLVHWEAPGLDRYAHDWLMAARGPLPAPDDIAIVAIDEPSMARFGGFPWPRSIMARTLDVLSWAQPKAIALDVLYADPSSPDQDQQLARAVARAGNVVVAAQLADPSVPGGPAAWLSPLPKIRQSAAAVGHVNVLAESEGVARALLIRVSDDSGNSLRALAIETVRVGDHTPEDEVTEAPGLVMLGSRRIPIQTEAPSVVLAESPGAPSPQVMRPSRMAVDYIGPTGSFAHSTFSLVDVVDGRVPAARFRRRYVLIGATAASMGDRLSSPFVHHADLRADRHGTLMPGVEVLANALNTILRSRFYAEVSDWPVFFCAAFVAALTLGLLAVSQGRNEGLKQIIVLMGVAVAVIAGAYLVFTRLLIFPPLAPGMVSFASAGVLGLLRRSLIASSRLDEGIAGIARAGTLLSPPAEPVRAAEAIAALTGAGAVAIFKQADAVQYDLAASCGAPVLRNRVRHDHGMLFALPPARHAETVRPIEGGLLAIAHPPGQAPDPATLKLSLAIAAGCLSNLGTAEEAPGLWPQGLEEKARVLGALNGKLIERTRFVDLALRSVEDGLIIAGPGR